MLALFLLYSVVQTNNREQLICRSTIGQILLTVRRIIEGVKARQIPATLLFVDFSKAFDSVHGEKTEKILLAYGIPKEIVTTLMILYRNTKLKVRSPDEDT